MVARYKPGPKKPHAGHFVKKENNGGKIDRRKFNGRPKGAENRIPKSIKEAVVEAMTLVGRDGKGDGGLVGYFRRICDADLVLGTRLAEKLIPPPQIDARGMVQVFQIPPDTIKMMSTPELLLLESVLKKIGGIDQPSGSTVIEHNADPELYAKKIGVAA